MQLTFHGSTGGMDALLPQCESLWHSLKEEPAFNGVLGWLSCQDATEGYLAQVKAKADPADSAAAS